MRWRVVTGVLRQDGKASFAADTAALNSLFVVKGTCDTTSCVAYHQKGNQSESKKNYIRCNTKSKVLRTHRVYHINGCR